MTLTAESPRLTRVRVLPTAKGAWRVLYRLNGKRRSTGAFADQDAAMARVAELRKRYRDTPAAKADTNYSALTVQGDTAP